MKAFVTNDIRPDVVSIDHGWWFPEKADCDYGLWESNANILTNNAPPYDAGFGKISSGVFRYPFLRWPTLWKMR